MSQCLVSLRESKRCLLFNRTPEIFLQFVCLTLHHYIETVDWLLLLRMPRMDMITTWTWFKACSKFSSSRTQSWLFGQKSTIGRSFCKNSSNIFFSPSKKILRTSGSVGWLPTVMRGGSRVRTLAAPTLRQRLKFGSHLWRNDITT